MHRHFLVQESEVFEAMFSCPQSGSSDGSSDDQPISLPEVKAREFERLLDFFYQGYVPTRLL
jgi:hypothetical protein